VRSVEDLLFHLPLRYQDRTRVRAIGSLRPGEEAVVAAVSGDLGCRLSVRTVVPTADLGHLCHVEIEGATPAAVVDAFENRAGVAHARVVRARGETGLVEVTVRAGPVATLLEHGATIRSLTATDGEATLLAETAPQSDVGTLVSDLEGSHEGAVFVAKRTLTRDAATMTATKTAIEKSLTERQREVLTLAYHAGFFASPRDSTGEELAEALGIAAPTFYQHVRTAVRKVLALLVDDEDLRTSSDRDESVVHAQ
jgi:predicted DNA binding protein